MRHILHADMDAFYASVEQRDNPDLAGKPVLVGGSPTSRGVVAAASYEARRFGVHSAMPMSVAVRQCPHAVIVRPRFDRYREVSDQIRAIFLGMTPLVEPLSLDEAYLDVTAVVTPDRSAESIAREIKSRVRLDVGLTISVGVSTCKSVAKVASDFDKPDGLTVVPPGDEGAFLAPLAVRKLWGIGPKTAARLEAEGVRTIGQLAAKPEEWFSRSFGKRGPEIRLMSMGQDDHPVSTERETKSVSAETTLAEDVSELEELRAIVSGAERAGSPPPRQQRPAGADGDAEAAAVGFHDVHAAGHPPLAGKRRFPDRRGRPGHPRARGDAGPLVPPHRRRRVPLRPRAGEPAASAVWGGVRSEELSIAKCVYNVMC